jgi:hypothetical protein
MLDPRLWLTFFLAPFRDIGEILLPILIIAAAVAAAFVILFIWRR